MAIYHYPIGTRPTAMLSPITIVAKHGPFTQVSRLAPGLKSTVWVVSFKNSDEMEGDTFLCTRYEMRADGGTEELMAAIEAAPLVPLTVEQIKYALGE